MSGEAAALCRSFPVGQRTVTITIPPVKVGVAAVAAFEWDPDLPRCLNRQERRQYRAGRDKAFAQLGKLLDINILVIEL